MNHTDELLQPTAKTIFPAILQQGANKPHSTPGSHLQDADFQPEQDIFEELGKSIEENWDSSVQN